MNRVEVNETNTPINNVCVMVHNVAIEEFRSNAITSVGLLATKSKEGAVETSNRPVG